MRILAVAALLGLSPLCAQRTWVVAQDGSGDFTTLQAAFAAAAHEDRILVRPGTPYDCTLTTSVGVTLVAASDWVDLDGQLVVQDLPADRVFRMKGEFRAVNSGFGPVFTARRCSGAVCLDIVQISRSWGYPLPDSQNVGMLVEDSPQVFATDCIIGGKPAIVATRSTLALTTCVVDGADAITQLRSSYALVAIASHVTLGFSRLTGGSAYWHISENAASPALALDHCALLVTGDAGTTISGGTALNGMAVLAISAIGGRIVRDPIVAITGGIDAPGTQITVRPIPALRGRPDLSSALWLTVRGEPHAAVVVLIGLPRAPLVTAFGDLWVDPAQHLVIGTAVLGDNGTLNSVARIGAHPPGLAVSLQAFTARETFATSNPVAVVLN